jgi:hypothetical protein
MVARCSPALQEITMVLPFTVIRDDRIPVHIHADESCRLFYDPSTWRAT